jgi:hypothetical protein
MHGRKKRPVRGLVPGAHVFFLDGFRLKTWMAGTSPAKADFGRAVALVER